MALFLELNSICYDYMHLDSNQKEVIDLLEISIFELTADTLVPLLKKKELKY